MSPTSNTLKKSCKIIQIEQNNFEVTRLLTNQAIMETMIGDIFFKNNKKYPY